MYLLDSIVSHCVVSTLCNLIRSLHTNTTSLVIAIVIILKTEKLLVGVPCQVPGRPGVVIRVQVLSQA